jgi:hypothetical protein
MAVKFSCQILAIVFLNEMFRVSTVHASILRLGSGLSTNGESYAIAILNPFTLSLSKPVLSLSKGMRIKLSVNQVKL